MLVRPRLIAGVLAVALGLNGCGGGGQSSAPPTNPNPVPSIVTTSPNSSKQGGMGFKLSVIGSNFIPSSAVQWNGSNLPTAFVSGGLITADVPASAVSSAGPDTITVMNPPPGGGVSNSTSFSVPCMIAPPAPAAAQTRARIGAYYFDGWSGPMTNFHFNGLPYGDFKDREPLSGWQDNSECAVEQQLAWAHNFGLSFFLFEWYWNTPVTEPGDNLNSALQITHALPDRHGMQFAIVYATGGPFDVPAASWPSAVEEWVSYMTDPDYVRVNGKPLFVILNIDEMRSVFGTSTAVRAALDRLRSAAQAKGLPGVYVVGNFGVDEGSLGQDPLCCGFTTVGAAGYDAEQTGAGPFTAPPVSGMVPYSTMADIAHWSWDESRLHSPIASVPVFLDGWDPRPWDERSSAGILMWYSRSPQEVAQLMKDAIDWANANPALRLEPSPAPPIVLFGSWNEVGEGNHIVPTVGEGSNYGDAIANMLTAP